MYYNTLECSVFICDFHREQAWERWLSKSINGCSTIKNDVKIMPRRIAHAKTIPNCKEAVKALKDSYEYKNYPKLIDYLKNTWFCIKKVSTNVLKIKGFYVQLDLFVNFFK